MFKKVICVLLLLCLALALFSCETGNIIQNEKKLYTFTRVDLFDTVTIIKGYEDSEEEFTSVMSKITPMLERYHRLFDIYYEYADVNNIRTINKNAGNAVSVPQELIEFLEYAKEVYEISDGKTNIALGSVLSIWHEYREEGTRLPSDDELEEASKHTDIEKLIIDKEISTVTLSDEYMSLDVGALAKGYVAEKVAKMLEESGKTGYILSLGGNIRTVGEKPDGEKWTLSVESPKLDGSYICRLDVGQYSLVTSGDYQRFYTVDGKDYNHIIDPDTLYPAEYFTLVSVLSPDSALADALSTALFCMSIDDGKKLLDSLEGTHALWLLKDGTIVYSDGIGEFLS